MPARRNMSLRVRALAATATLWFAVFGAAPALKAQPSVTIIPSMDPGTPCLPQSIAPDGSGVVGAGVLDQHGQAFLYRDGVSGGLSPVEGRPYPWPASATGVSNACGVLTGQMYPDNAFVWTAAAGTRVLPQTENVGGSYRVSADGTTIVGEFRVPSANLTPSIDHVSTNTVEYLGLAGQPYGATQGVSGDGSTVCGWAFSSAGEEQAFVWTAASGATYLPFLSNQPNRFCSATAVSLDGTCVVGFGSTPNAIQGEPFRWTRSGGMQLIPMLPGAVAGSAEAASADGSVVIGNCLGGGGGPGFTPFVWDAAQGTRRLIDVAIGLGLPLQGWRLDEVTGLSADGTTMTVYAVDSHGASQGLVIHVPAPGCVVTCPVCLLAAHRRRRRGG